MVNRDIYILDMINNSPIRLKILFKGGEFMPSTANLANYLCYEPERRECFYFPESV